MSYRERTDDTLRVLFCIGVTQTFFDEEPGRVGAIVDDIKAAFGDLRGRFGIEVLGTMDDDELMVGSSATWPWTCYILAAAPDLEAVKSVCNLVRVSDAPGGRLWRYLKIEARVGRPLFFGDE